MCEMLAVIIVASIAFDECFSGALNPFRTGESTDVLAVPFGLSTSTLSEVRPRGMRPQESTTSRLSQRCRRGSRRRRTKSALSARNATPPPPTRRLTGRPRRPTPRPSDQRSMPGAWRSGKASAPAQLAVRGASVPASSFSLTRPSPANSPGKSTRPSHVVVASRSDSR